MVIFQITAVALSAMFLSTVCATAQNTISLASNLTREGRPASSSCQEQAAVLARELADFPRPDTWHWVIVCDDSGWRQFLRQRDGFPADMGVRKESIYASTHLAAHLTCLRGSTLLRPDSPLAKADHVVAHELAHILLHTADEERAEQRALFWLGERQQRSGNGAAGR